MYSVWSIVPEGEAPGAGRQAGESPILRGLFRNGYLSWTRNVKTDKMRSVPKHPVSPKPLSPVARLQLLLPWLNGDPDVLPDERAALFLRSGAVRVGSRELSGVRAGRWEADAVRADLLAMLDGRARNLPLPSLQVDVRRDGARYQLTVHGEPRDAVLYQVARILTDAGAVALARCGAPASGAWKQTCGRWFITGGARRGRTAHFCSTTCRVRSFRKVRSRRLASTGRRKRGGK